MTDNKNPDNKNTGNTNPVTVMGLGLMGSTLARAFLDAGHPTTVWNRSAAKAESLVASGATRAESAAGAFAASPLVVICLSVNQNVHDVLEGAGNAVAGRTVVNLTNGTPAQARELATAVTALGGEYVDGGIMAVPPMIAQPGALILYSGRETAFETHQATLEVLAEARYLGTDPGLAPLYDLALLTAMYGMLTGYYQATALIRTEGVKAAEFTPMVHAWVTAMMAGLPRAAEAIDSGEHATEVSSLANNQAAFPNLIEAAREQGVDTSLMEPVRALLDRSVAEGYGDDGLPRLTDLLSARP
ncbi:NAD(P)-dependent oxidoreductase [Actinomadura barringtoniae]|uniref:NAD(P)-dependent oxidoreductase n=1 Tax=Actinomadura barringtoniae TaxID=1427535 RepID=A0A939P9B2_9ACTN|nr:NAD(P)-binding domain-containing protein [Actinomadura barringtoniae]MBO2445698.1 NAD(P)-dependent oxidoreductase [Actinomadura barringtoniae]